MAWKKGKRFTDDTTMPFAEIAERLGISVTGAVVAYDRAMEKLRIRFSSPARRKWLLELLAPLPSAPGHVAKNLRNPQPISQMRLRNYPIIRSRRQRESSSKEIRDKVL